MRGATNQLHACRPGTARATPVPWAMSKAAFWSLWCFVFVLPWDVLTNLPVVGSIPRLVGLAASAVGVLYILARWRVRPLSWFHMFAVLFVLWAGATSLWSVDPEATQTGLVGLSIIPWTLRRMRLRTKVALYALAAGSLVLASYLVPNASLARIASTRADIEAGYFGGRGPVWLAGLEVAREHPLVGVGAGGYPEAVEPTIGQEMVAHNVLLSILVEDGTVGFLLFVAMLVALLTPLRHLPALHRRLSIVLLLTLAVGTMALSWDHRKQFWFVLGMVAVQVAEPTARSSLS